ncbi:MAG: hypothetical protein AAF730_00930 [Bacteroidota bacterium]
MAVFCFALVGCDSATAVEESEPEPQELAAGTFIAKATTADGVTDLEGQAAASLQLSNSEFSGTFIDYALTNRDADGDAYFMSAILLTADTGEELTLGYISAGERMQSGTYGIEANRNLTPPYDFVSIYDAAGSTDGSTRGGDARGQSGEVNITVENGRVTGTFDVVYSDGTTLRGEFSADPN